MARTYVPRLFPVASRLHTDISRPFGCSSEHLLRCSFTLRPSSKHKPLLGLPIWWMRFMVNGA